MFKVKLGTSKKWVQPENVKNGQKLYFYWDFLIFDDSNRLLSLKNPHLDTSDTKIGLKTPKLLISNP